jgi:hypothetical protein
MGVDPQKNSVEVMLQSTGFIVLRCRGALEASMISKNWDVLSQQKAGKQKKPGLESLSPNSVAVARIRRAGETACGMPVPARIPVCGYSHAKPDVSLQDRELPP